MGEAITERLLLAADGKPASGAVSGSDVEERVRDLVRHAEAVALRLEPSADARVEAGPPSRRLSVDGHGEAVAGQRRERGFDAAGGGAQPGRLRLNARDGADGVEVEQRRLSWDGGEPTQTLGVQGGVGGAGDGRSSGREPPGRRPLWRRVG